MTSIVYNYTLYNTISNEFLPISENTHTHTHTHTSRGRQGGLREDRKGAKE